MINEENILEIKNLNVKFELYKNLVEKYEVEVIKNLTLTLKAGEILSIIGASGSGKSVLTHSILNLLPKNSKVTGQIKYNGEKIEYKNISKLLGKDISYIPQSVDYLDPVMKIGKQVLGVSGNYEKMINLFKKYKLPLDIKDKYPFEISGGMARRVLICASLMNDPKFLIADEPTPGVDKNIEKEIIKDFKDISSQNKSILIITHNIDFAINVSDSIAVFLDGNIIEKEEVSKFLSGGNLLENSYSKSLIKSLPQNEFESKIF
ncbi:MAG: ATP-binding cassette domain-containing protein [Peptoniphilaceae bacterium]|nr:ATP-binding cassette domain-containing protein [Peptoniphilaceae bacterium]MDD7383823.1 ATP-binding cassette domain-containing protein [Peptoniphilaceae bacterium]MDY3737600.1 ATP-binding cassette domain-containing protein [Peptoniphilaceae bacterium]